MSFDDAWDDHPGGRRPDRRWVPFPGWRPGPSAPDTPLSQPYYGAPFRVALRRFWRNYAAFTGRASRSEFWWAVLGFSIGVWVLEIRSFAAMLIVFAAAADHAGGELTPSQVPAVFLCFIPIAAWGLANFVPLLAVWSRRLRDTRRSPWLLLVYPIPYVGAILLCVWAAGGTKPDPDRYVSSASDLISRSEPHG